MERWCQVHYVMKYRLVIYGPTINHPEQYACVYVFFSIILFDFCQIEQIFLLSILSCFNKNQVWLITRRSPEVGYLYEQFFFAGLYGWWPIRDLLRSICWVDWHGNLFCPTICVLVFACADFCRLEEYLFYMGFVFRYFVFLILCCQDWKLGLFWDALMFCDNRIT